MLASADREQNVRRISFSVGPEQLAFVDSDPDRIVMKECTIDVLFLGSGVNEWPEESRRSRSRSSTAYRQDFPVWMLKGSLYIRFPDLYIVRRVIRSYQLVDSFVVSETSAIWRYGLALLIFLAVVVREDDRLVTGPLGGGHSDFAASCKRCTTSSTKHYLIVESLAQSFLQGLRLIIWVSKGHSAEKLWRESFVDEPQEEFHALIHWPIHDSKGKRQDTSSTVRGISNCSSLI